MLKYSIMLFGFLLPEFAQSQQGIIFSGRITDESGYPVEHALVQIKETQRTSITDVNGNFEIHNVPEEQFIILITHVSFLPFEEKINTQVKEDFLITLKENPHVLPQVFVINKHNLLFSKIPGSVSYIDNNELDKLKPISGNEVFRRIPGLNVVDEEGAGLRVNIGIRGLDPDRSRSVLIMEDGVPVALNPYGEPEMYYSPAIDRMNGVEVLKGSGQILYGPQTVGGVINYITAAPPEKEEIRLKLQGGKGTFLTALGSYGNTFNKTGVQIDYLHKRADDFGALNFTVNDFTAKVKFLLSERATFGIKLSAYDEVSNSTYVGLTQSMFETGGYDFSVLMPNDELDVRRYLMSFSNNINLRKGINLQSMLYGYTTTRNWRRQGYSYNSYTATNPNPPPSDWTGVVLGDESTDGGAIYLRDRTGNRNRQFEVIGWEQKILHNKSFGNFNNELIAGYRILYERAYEQRINGTNDQAKSGDLISDEIRTGNALSLFALNKFSISQKLDITPGVRVEFYSYEREILREANIDTNRVADNQIREVIPGFGVNYRPASKLNFFTGIHRGYAPPRIKDAIDFSAVNPVLELEAEKSWNLEVGLRSQPIKGMFLEVTWFYMDFENQIIPSSQSIGGPGFGVTNAGRTLHKGFETSFTLDSREFLTSNWKIQFDLSATTIKAIYNSDRLVSSGNDQVNVRGNRLPYAPEFTLSSGFSIEAPFGTGLRLTDNYIGNQFTDELNTVNASFNGRIGKIGSRNVLDATLYHIISSMNATINISIKNVTDERYIATRRPEGIRVGLPRYITAGFAIKF